MSKDRNASEEEYFVRLEREERAQAQVAAEAARGVAELAEQKLLHAQRCGKCGGLLTPRDFRGVEIDVCEACGCVLLDPGELEQLAGKDASGALAGIASMFRFKR